MYTKEQIAKAFEIWNKSVIENPTKFDKLETGIDFANRQADELVKIITDNNL